MLPPASWLSPNTFVPSCPPQSRAVLVRFRRGLPGSSAGPIGVLLEPELDHLLEQREPCLLFPRGTRRRARCRDDRNSESRCRCKYATTFLMWRGPARVFDFGGQESAHERRHFTGRFACAFVLEPRLPELGISLLDGLGHAISNRLDQEREPEGRRVFQARLRCARYSAPRSRWPAFASKITLRAR